MSANTSTQSLAASDGDSAVAMDFQEIAASPEMTSCQNCHANLKGTEECVVCRVEVRATWPWSRYYYECHKNCNPRNNSAHVVCGLCVCVCVCVCVWEF